MIFRALIVGCGRIAGRHARAWSKTSGAAVAGFVDIVGPRAERLARTCGRTAHGSDLAAALAKLRPDAVLICTPDSTHFQLAGLVLQARPAPKVVFLEKPACAGTGELRRLSILARRAGVFVLVNHTRRFDPRHRRLREWIRRGRLGRLVRADAFYYGGWRHNGTHVVDTLRFLFGEVALKRVVGSQPSRHPGDPTLSVLLRVGRDGAEAHLHGFDERHYQIFDMDIKFDRARLRIENFGSRWTLERKALVGGENVLVGARGPFKLRNAEPCREAAALIIRFLRTGDRAPLAACTLDEAEGTVRAVWEAGRK